MIIKIIKVLSVIVAAFLIVYFIGGIDKGKQNIDQDVIIFTPVAKQKIQSPLQVAGKARGTWFFEANIIVRIKDSNGNTIALKGVQAKEDWMTTDYVNFEDSIEFSKPNTDNGVLIVEADNPSGDPNNIRKFEIPLEFK
jgi:hypothetical protein